MGLSRRRGLSVAGEDTLSGQSIPHGPCDIEFHTINNSPMYMYPLGFDCAHFNPSFIRSAWRHSEWQNSLLMGLPSAAVFMVAIVAATVHACPSECRCHDTTVDCKDLELTDV